MNIAAHEEFAKDQIKFWSGYSEISDRVAIRFQQQVDEAIFAIVAYPLAAGHFFYTGERQVKHLRRRNFKRFPFFILYSYDPTADALFFGAVIPSRSNPRHWLDRFPEY